MNKLLIKNATLVNEGRIYASDVLICLLYTSDAADE